MFDQFYTDALALTFRKEKCQIFDHFPPPDKVGIAFITLKIQKERGELYMILILYRLQFLHLVEPLQDPRS